MKKLGRAALVAIGLAIPTTSLLATSAHAATTAPADSVDTGAPAYQRCIAAGGTAHFCGELGGYWYFTS